MIVINLFGGPGSGKSTTAAGVFSELKQRGISCELVTEVAKDLVWDEAFEMLKDQHLLFALQRHRLVRLEGKVDYAITDSPLITGLMYGFFTHSFAATILEEQRRFASFNYLMKRVKPYDPVGRMQTEEEAIAIDSQFASLLMEHIPFLEIEGGTKHGIAAIVDDVEKQEKRKCDS